MALTLSTLSAPAQSFVFKADVIRTPAPQIQWTSRPNYCYSVECSTDLQTWTTDGVLRQGTGDWMAKGFSFSGSSRLYLRAREDYMGWMTSPLPGQSYNKEGGVAFGFDLASFSPLPAKICISKRANSSAPWQLIGSITDITTLKGVKTVRGPAVWLPSETGSCQVRAQAKNSSGTVIATAERSISIFANTPPTVNILGYEEGQSKIGFPTDVSNEVRRVEYYDLVPGDVVENFVGTDYEAPFGDRPAGGIGAFADPLDGILNPEGEHYFYPNKLLLGAHVIKAKAFDKHGGVSTATFNHAVTSGPARPSLWLTNFPTSDYSTFNQADIFTVEFGAIPAPGFPSSLHSFSAGLSLPYTVEPPRITFWNSQTGSVAGDTTAFTPGTSLYIMRGSLAYSGIETYPRQHYVQVDSPAFANALDMVANMLDEDSAPLVSGSLPRFMGPYAAAQPYTGGNAAGLDAPKPPPPLPDTRVMDTGVVFTTGKFSFWNENDLRNDRGHSWLSPGDTTIHDKIDGSYLRDASSIEFYVNCIHPQFEMELQFGSEEWDDLLPLAFNNLDITTKDLDSVVVTLDNALLSLTPDGASPLSMTSIHPALFPDIPACRDHLYLTDNLEINTAAVPGPQVEYDGMTVRLRLHAFVTPGVHKLKIAIADRDKLQTRSGPANYDSALFIRSDSIRTRVPTP